MDIGYICVSGCRKEAVVRHAQHVRSALSSSRSDRGHHWQRKQTSDTPVRFHVVTHQASAMLASWAAQYLLSSAPSLAVALHANLSAAVARTRPRIFLWKPLLHLLLPANISRVLILDVDTVFFEDPRLLWQHFARFGAQTVMGLAKEQAPTYRDLGVDGVNGGVQLMDLEKMRRSDAYSRALAAAVRQGWLRGDRNRGLGDQTLYSMMQVRAQPGLFYRLPCGWNRQMSVYFGRYMNFSRSYQCETGGEGCALAHGNQPAFKGLVGRLQDPQGAPSCAACRAATQPPQGREAAQPTEGYGSLQRVALLALLRCCCANTSTSLAATARPAVRERKLPSGAPRVPQSVASLHQRVTLAEQGKVRYAR